MRRKNRTADECPEARSRCRRPGCHHAPERQNRPIDPLLRPPGSEEPRIPGPKTIGTENTGKGDAPGQGRKTGNTPAPELKPARNRSAHTEPASIDKTEKGGLATTFFRLSCRDSNPERQNQNLLCYHYTTAQTRARKRDKDNEKFTIPNPGIKKSAYSPRTNDESPVCRDRQPSFDMNFSRSTI